MLNSRSAVLFLSVLVVLGGLWVVLQGEESSSPAPMVHVDEPVRSPGTATGVAAIPGGGDVVVRAYIDGEEIGVDDTMDGNMNEFSFDIPAGNKGKLLQVDATGSDGQTSTAWVPII